MRAFIGSNEYQGTPEEISQFLSISIGVPANEAAPNFLESDFEPFEDIVNGSEELRKKLAENPDYNPHGGVIPSRESEEFVGSPAIEAPFTAEEDTGVKTQ